MVMYALLDKVDLDIYGLFFSKKDAEEYLKDDIYEECCNDFKITKVELKKELLQELNRKIVNHLADKHL